MSVIVPARNEETSLATCLRSLIDQASGQHQQRDRHTLITPDGVTFEIIVIDDGSTDRTREIGASFDCVRVVDAGPLPRNWTGKSNACAAGARVARGEWLLFTDADTFHKPGSLSRAVEEAKRYGVGLLSYSPEQEAHGFAERAVMPVIFAELATRYKPKAVCDPASPVAAANGQFLLVTREAYDAVGGHSAVATELLEDVAIARLVKRSGRRLRFRFGGDAVRTRMYRDFAQLREGWGKNLALLFPAPGRLAAFRLAEFAVAAGAFTGAVVGFATGSLAWGCGFGIVAAPT